MLYLEIMIRFNKIAIERVEIVILYRVFALLCFVLRGVLVPLTFLQKIPYNFLKKKRGFLSSSSITVYYNERCKINT